MYLYTLKPTQTALDYYPYGKELRSYNSTAEKYKSTTNERDLETGYDFRNARSSAADVVRFNSVDPMASKYPSLSWYSYVGGNPVRFVDHLGEDWYISTKGDIEYEPSVRSPKDLSKGETYLGKTYAQTTKLGNISYRIDGSIFFTNQVDAYNRLWKNASARDREQFGVILSNGILVLPDYYNDKSTSEIEDYCYKLSDGKLTDPLSEKPRTLLATIHTHRVDTGEAEDAAPSGDGITNLTSETPNKAYLTMGFDGNLHGGYGDKTGRGYLDFPKGLVGMLLKGDLDLVVHLKNLKLK